MPDSPRSRYDSLVAQLTPVLGTKARPVARDLDEAALADYVATHHQWNTAGLVRDGRRVLKRIRALERILASTSPSFRHSFNLAIIRDLRALGGVDVALPLREWRSKLEHLINHTLRQPKGHPRSEERSRLAGDIAYMVNRAGVRLSKGRDGKLAKVLEIAFRAVGEPVPADMFDVVRDAVDEAHRRLGFMNGPVEQIH